MQPMTQDSDGAIVDVVEIGWGERIRDSLMAPLVGLLLFLGAFVLLFWNEGRAVEAFAALDRGARIVVDVPADRVDPVNEGKLVHLTGQARVAGVLVDSATGIGGPGLLRLERQVEMYQWHEHRSDKQIEYRKEWASSQQNSDSFRNRQGHENPRMPLRNASLVSATVSLGAFAIDRKVTGEAEPLTELGLIGMKPSGNFKLSDDGLYQGQDPANPQVGDLRLTFRVVQAGDLSVVAAQRNGRLLPYLTPDGPSIALAQTGFWGAPEMFKAARDQETILTWVLRLVGVVLMFAGVALVFKPFSALLSGIPLIGDLFDAGVGLVAFVVALPLSFAVIGLAWLFHRPVLAIGIFAVGAAVAGAVVWWGRRRKPVPAAN